METKTKESAKKKTVNPKQREAEKKIIKRIVLGVLAFMILVTLDANYKFTAALQTDNKASGKWQAVFLTNDQVYFGHLSQYGINYWKLDDAHYIKVTQVPVATPLTGSGQAAQKANTEPQMENRTTLMKVSQDVHQPEGTLYIPKEHILFWQDLQDGSSVTQTLKMEGSR